MLRINNKCIICNILFSLNKCSWYLSVILFSLSSNNIEQSTSNSNNQRTEKRIKMKSVKKSPGFDDFVPLLPIKKQYKGHRNARY